MNPAIAAAVMGGSGLVFGRVLAAVSLRLAQGAGFAAGHTRISRRYPLIESGAMAIGVWSALWAAEVSASMFLMAATAVLGWQLLLIAVVDGEQFWLPDILTLPLIVTGLVVAATAGWDVAVSHLMGAAAGFGGLWLAGRLYQLVRRRQGLGGGDPFLFAGAVAWVGWVGLPSVLLWACAVALSSVFVLLVARRSVSARRKLPFGVFLAVGVWLTWLYGPLGL